MLLQMVSNSLILLVILLYFTNLVEVSGYVSVSGSYSCNSVNDCSNEILACTKEASSCTINCQGQYYCQNTVVYSAATTTTINCDAFYGCNTMSIYCGDLSIANERHNLYFPNGLSESDFVRDTTSTDVITCDVNPIYSQSFMNGFFGCYGDIIDQCTMDSNTFWGIQSSTFECDTRFGGDSSNTDCIASCDLECSVTLDCYAKGNNANYDQCECSGNYGTNNPTYCSINSNKIPTVLPTELPTNKPSVQPTNKPSVEPTDKPSNYPTDKPSNMPSVNPSDRPTSMPSTETTNNNNNNNNNDDDETAGPSGSTTSGVYPSTVVSATSTMATSNRPANVSNADDDNNNDNDAVIGDNNGSNGNDSTLMIIAICLGITFLLVMVICGVGVAYMRKNKKENEKNGKNSNLPTSVTGIVGRGSTLTFETNSDGTGDAALGGAVVAAGGSGSGSVNIILPQNTDGAGNFSQVINSNSPSANDGEIGTFGFGDNSPQSDTNDKNNNNNNDINNNLLNVGNGKGLPPAPETDESLLRNTDNIDHENQSDSDKMYDNNNNNDDNNDNNENELELHNVEGMSIADGQTGAFFMGENDNNNDNNNNNNNNDDEAQYINDDDYANPGASPRSRGIGNSKRFTNQGKKNRKRTDGDIATPRGVVALPKLPQIV